MYKRHIRTKRRNEVTDGWTDKRMQKTAVKEEYYYNFMSSIFCLAEQGS